MLLLRSVCVVLVLLLLSEVIFGQSCPSGCSGHGTCRSGACQCDAGWGGADCASRLYSITPNSAGLSGQSVATGSFNYYVFSQSQVQDILVNVTQDAGTTGDCDVYLQVNNYATLYSFVARDVSMNAVSIVSVQRAQAGTWYVGVYGYSACRYSVRVTASACPNACSNHGTCSASSGTCSCNSGYAGADCSLAITPLTASRLVGGYVATGASNLYSFAPAAGTSSVLFTMNQTSAGDADIYVSAGVVPSTSVFDVANLTAGMLSTVRITNVPSGVVYYVRVYGFSAASYNLVATTTSSGGGNCPNQCSQHGTCQGGVCSCQANFVGTTDCSDMISPFTLGSTVAGYVGDNAWNYYHVQAFTADSLIFTVVQTSTDNFADCDLYIRPDAKPTRSVYAYVDFSQSRNFSLTVQQPGSSVWYAGVYGWYPCAYTISVTTSSACSCGTASDGLRHGACSPGTSACACDAGWSGPDCTSSTQLLRNAVNLPGQTITINAWNYYAITVTSSYFQVAVKETSTVGYVWLFVSRAQTPSLTIFDDADQSPASSIHYAQFQYESQQTYTYYIGVYGSTFIASTSTVVPYQIVAWAPPV